MTYRFLKFFSSHRRNALSDFSRTPKRFPFNSNCPLQRRSLTSVGGVFVSTSDQGNQMSKILIGFVISLLAFSTSSHAQSTAEAFQKRGAQRFAQGDYDGAIADFTDAIDLSSRL